jgi:hypothetical protein
MSPNWRKSSLCSNDNGCVEVSFTGGDVLVRDSKDPFSAQLRFTAKEWLMFLGGVMRGEFGANGLTQDSVGADQASRFDDGRGEIR